MPVKISSSSTCASRTNTRSSTWRAKLIPLGDLPNRLGELDPNREIVMHCKSGGRSQKASELLAQSGFKKLHNLAGGITGWATDVDPKVPKY